MSDLGRESGGTVYGCSIAETDEPASVLLPGHDVPLGRYTTVRRLLPQRRRRMVGAWCFVDHFGPEDVTTGEGMRVPPHPHTGLQTVTWLVAGEVLHRDTIGSVATIHPGDLNLMTAGRGIAHSEESPAQRPPTLHGVQLWVALPSQARHGEPAFEHHEHLPVVDVAGGRLTVLVGALHGTAESARSPATAYTPLLAAELLLDAGADVDLPLDTTYEHAVLLLAGDATVDGDHVAADTMVYVGPGTQVLALRAGESGVRALLLGGEPFEEQLVMWWNFVARSHDEIVAMRGDWEAGREFGTVEGYAGDPLPAPAMPTVRLKPRGRSG